MKNLREDLWTQAFRIKGELDQYINFLISNPKQSSKAELTDMYADRVDYDTAMLALTYDAVQDDVAEERYDAAGNSLGKLTQRELIDKVLANQAQRWDVQIKPKIKNLELFGRKHIYFEEPLLFAQVGANMINIVNGINRGINFSGNLQAGVMTIIDRVEGKVKTDKRDY